jgi:5,10-methylenetetrahydromethanopterin reductase
MGRAARTMQEYRETVEFIKRYLAGEEAEFQGDRMHSGWIKRPVPIYMAATGPASCQLAGELADGVIIGFGVHPEVVKWRLEHVARGADKAGRDPATIDTWARTMIVIAESREAARREASAYASNAAWMTFRLQTPAVDELRRRLARVMPDLDELIADSRNADAVYNEYFQERIDSPHSKEVTQRLVDYLHLTGTPEDICERIQQLRELGIKNISATVFTAVDRQGLMRNIASTIMPRFQD